MARSASVVKCEKHGLHYDAAKTSGCVVCRRESGELPPVRSGGVAAASSGSLGAALAVTAVLVVLTTFAMQIVHTQFIEWLRNTGSSSTFQTGNPYQQQMQGVMKELEDQSKEPDTP